jgi:general stress protein 26
MKIYLFSNKHIEKVDEAKKVVKIIVNYRFSIKYRFCDQLTNCINAVS